MELRQLRYFVEVAEREHVSEAAEHLHIAQSAISRQISRLEDELGVLLFEKIGRNIQLTPIGKIFLIHAKTAIQAIEYAKYQIEEFWTLNTEALKSGSRRAFPPIYCLPSFPLLKMSSRISAST